MLQGACVTQRRKDSFMRDFSGPSNAQVHGERTLFCVKWGGRFIVQFSRVYFIQMRLCPWVVSGQGFGAHWGDAACRRDCCNRFPAAQPWASTSATFCWWSESLRPAQTQRRGNSLCPSTYHPSPGFSSVRKNGGSPVSQNRPLHTTLTPPSARLRSWSGQR